MYLSNTLIYKNCLVAANKYVAESKLDLDFSKMFFIILLKLFHEFLLDWICLLG